MTGESRGCSRAAAPGCGFSRGTTARSVSLSWGTREVGSPLVPFPALWWRSDPYSGIKPRQPTRGQLSRSPTFLSSSQNESFPGCCVITHPPAQKAPVAKSGWQMIKFIDSEMLIQMDKKSLQQISR